MPDYNSESDAVYPAIVEPLLAWYAAAARTLPWRENRDPYRVWVSEIMLQQTRVEAVRAYYLRFMETFPDVHALAEAPEDTLLKAWEGLGYYARARYLQKTARIIAARYGGVFPRSRDALMQLPGIGPYTAGAIASICFDLPEPAVDGNVLRVAARLTECFQPMEPLKNQIAKKLRAVYPSGRCGDFTQSLMELGAMVCLPGAPRCEQCPLSHICIAFKNGSMDALPVTAVKKPRRIEEITVFLVWMDGKLALRRRARTGLLAGMWEPPNLPGTLTEEQARRTIDRWGLALAELCPPFTEKHIFTHVQWNMTCYVAYCAGTADSGAALACDSAAKGVFWAAPDALRDEYALPTAFKKLLVHG